MRQPHSARVKDQEAVQQLACGLGACLMRAFGYICGLCFHWLWPAPLQALLGLDRVDNIVDDFLCHWQPDSLRLLRPLALLTNVDFLRSSRETTIEVSLVIARNNAHQCTRVVGCPAGVFRRAIQIFRWALAHAFED